MQHLNIITDLGAVISENKEDKLTVFLTSEKAISYGLQNMPIKMKLIWVKHKYFERVKVVDYSICAYKGSGFFALTNYPKLGFTICGNKPLKSKF